MPEMHERLIILDGAAHKSSSIESRSLCIFKLKTGRDSEKESRPVCVSGAKERIEQCDLMQKNSADLPVWG